MQKKYYATKGITLGGITYNIGDIVWSDCDRDGLKPMEESTEINLKTINKGKKNDLAGSDNPIISVIITFHNQQRFVRRCLDSFIRQDVSVPYEIIAVVDKSEEDEVSEICKNFEKIVVVISQAGNACAARNIGIDTARGKYLAFFDGDDWAFPNYLSKLLSALEKKDADFAYARFRHKDYGLVQGNLPRCNVMEWGTSFHWFSPVTNTPILIKKEKAPRWDEGLEIMQDMDYSLKLTGLKGVHVREELWFYDDDHGVWHRPGVKEKKERAIEILKQRGFRDDPAEVTFVSLISRDEVLDEYFGQIPSLKLPKATHWLVIIDSNCEEFIEKIKRLVSLYEWRFQSLRIFVTGEDGLAYSKDFEARGMRIARTIKIIINEAGARYGGTPFLFMVEDDTLAPAKCYKKLMNHMMKDESMAYVSGVECGRGFTRHTGVCEDLIEDDTGEIVVRKIPKMKKNGLMEIKGGGWYCWIGRINLLKEFLREKKMRCCDGKMLGPDVMMVYDLQKMGFTCLADFSIQCYHYDSRRKVWLSAMEGKGYNITFVKDSFGRWTYNLLELT